MTPDREYRLCLLGAFLLVVLAVLVGTVVAPAILGMGC